MVVTLDLGDVLELRERPQADGVFTLACDDPEVPVNEHNLVLKAARAFAQAADWKGGVDFALRKRTPTGAGLGGGSSDGTGTLKGLNSLAGLPLDGAALHRLAAMLGSDCPLFLEEGPQCMRGRGERLEPWTEASARIGEQRVLLFKPPFGVNTAWAYGQLAARAPGSYFPEGAAEERLSAWRSATSAPLEALLFNSMELPVFDKYPALPVLAGRLQATFGLRTHMSGSGSACFALLTGQTPVEAVAAVIRKAWGPSAFVRVARIRGSKV